MSKIASQAVIDKSLAALNELCRSFEKSTATMRDRGQKLLVGIASHWKITGSNAGLADLLNELVTSDHMKGVNAPAIVAYAEKHLGMFVGEDAEGNKRLLFRSDFTRDNLNMEALKAERWYELKKQAPFAFSQMEQLRKLIAASEAAAGKAEKALDAGREVGEVSTHDDVTKLLKAALRKAEELSRVDAGEAPEFIPDH